MNMGEGALGARAHRKLWFRLKGVALFNSAHVARREGSPLWPRALRFQEKRRIWGSWGRRPSVPHWHQHTFSSARAGRTICLRLRAACSNIEANEASRAEGCPQPPSSDTDQVLVGPPRLSGQQPSKPQANSRKQLRAPAPGWAPSLQERC